MHPSDLVLDIVGIAAGNQGRRCKEHMVCCSKVVEEDIVVCLCKERIIVPNFLAGKGKKREETTITVYWVMDSIDRCHMRFLPRAYALDGTTYNGVLCQVMEVFEKNDPSCAIHEKWHTNNGFARATVISVLNECILSKGGGETATMVGMKRVIICLNSP